MKLNVLVLLFTIGIAAQAQTVVRKDGASTGADSRVNDLSISNGLYLGLDDWRFGVQVPVLAVQEVTESYDYEMFVALAPHLTVERLSSIPAFKWKGALGLSRGDSLGEFSQTGAYLAGGVRLDFLPVNFFFYEQSRSLELMAETILDVDPKYMLTLNISQTIVRCRHMIRDVTFRCQGLETSYIVGQNFDHIFEQVFDQGLWEGKH